ncbi:unnamed protein product [Closterium sp. NIES-54]
MKPFSLSLVPLVSCFLLHSPASSSSPLLPLLPPTSPSPPCPPPLPCPTHPLSPLAIHPLPPGGARSSAHQHQRLPPTPTPAPSASAGTYASAQPPSATTTTRDEARGGPPSPTYRSPDSPTQPHLPWGFNHGGSSCGTVMTARVERPSLATFVCS